MSEKIVTSEVTSKFKSVERMVWADGWLAPDGRFHPCSPTEHNDCANFIFHQDRDAFLSNAVQHTGKTETELSQIHPRYIIDALGYVRLSASEFNVDLSPNDLTDPQLKTVLLSQLQVGPWVYTPQLPQELFDPFAFKTTFDNHKALTAFCNSPRNGFYAENNPNIGKKVWQRLAEYVGASTLPTSFKFGGVEGELNLLPGNDNLIFTHTIILGTKREDFIACRTKETVDWLHGAVRR